MFESFRRRPSARRASTPQLSVNALDRRDLPSVTLSGGILTIIGTNGRDLANVSQTVPGQIRVQLIKDVTSSGFSDVESLYTSASSVTRVVFQGLGGNDYLNNATSIQTYAYGGTGNDELRAGSGNDFLYGADGVDRLYGNAGNDRLDGGADGDADFLYGGTGADTFKHEWSTYVNQNGMIVLEDIDRGQDVHAWEGDQTI